MTRQAKTKATPTTMPSNFQNKCCSSRADRQLLNSFLLDELHVIFSTYPVEPHSGVVLIWKLEHGVHSSVTTNSSTNQHGEVEVLTKRRERKTASRRPFKKHFSQRLCPSSFPTQRLPSFHVAPPFSICVLGILKKTLETNKP